MMKLFLDMLTLSQYKHLFTTCPPCHHTDLPTQLCVSSDWLTLLIFPWLLLMTPHWHWHPQLGPEEISAQFDKKAIDTELQPVVSSEHELWAAERGRVSESYERTRPTLKTTEANKQPVPEMSQKFTIEISDYSLDIVDSPLLIRGRLPSEGESPAPAAVPRGVWGEPARAARHVAEIKES